jgi:hypothetical protein
MYVTAMDKTFWHLWLYIPTYGEKLQTYLRPLCRSFTCNYSAKLIHKNRLKVREEWAKTHNIDNPLSPWINIYKVTENLAPGTNPTTPAFTTTVLA